MMNNVVTDPVIGKGGGERVLKCWHEKKSCFCFTVILRC